MSASQVSRNPPSLPPPPPITVSKPPNKDIQITIDNSTNWTEIPINVTCIIVVSNCCNDLKSLNLNEYRYLKSIEIGNGCFENGELFKIDGLNEMKSLKIGNNSFTHLKNNTWNDDLANNPNRSFSILNCIALESIEIGRYSFSDYGGGFELDSLPKLSTIKIDTFNFFYSSFVVKGIIDMILLMIRSSKFEFH